MKNYEMTTTTTTSLATQPLMTKNNKMTATTATSTWPLTTEMQECRNKQKGPWDIIVNVSWASDNIDDNDNKMCKKGWGLGSTNNKGPRDVDNV